MSHATGEIPPFLQDHAAVKRLIKKVEYDLVRKAAKARGYTGRLPSKPTLVNELVAGTALPELVSELTNVPTRSYLDPQPELSGNGVVVQVGKLTFGPLGVLESDCQRRDANRIVEFLQEAASAELLAYIANACSAAHPLRPICFKYLKTLPKHAKRHSLLQLALCGDNDVIAAAVNDGLRAGHGALRIPHDFWFEDWMDEWRCESAPARPFQWGIPRFDDADAALLEALEEGDSTRAFATLLLRVSRAAVRQAIHSFSGADDVSRASELVLQEGPAPILERYFSDASIWELLESWDLVVPPLGDVARQDLLEALLYTVGLSYVPKPRGLHWMRRALRQADGEAPTTPLETALMFEQLYEELTAAFIVLCAGIEDYYGCIPKLLRGRPKNLKKEWSELVPEAGIRSLSFGAKVDVMRATLTRLSGEETETRWAGKPRPNALAGSEVQRVVAARNGIAHGRSKGDLESMRALVLDALDAMIGEDPALYSCPVPYKVRVLREVRDVYGWRRLELETELGQQVRCDGSIESGERPAFLFGDSTPSTVAPRLVW